MNMNFAKQVLTVLLCCLLVQFAGFHLGQAE
jgi:hypothetical protein